MLTLTMIVSPPHHYRNQRQSHWKDKAFVVVGVLACIITITIITSSPSPSSHYQHYTIITSSTSPHHQQSSSPMRFTLPGAQPPTSASPLNVSLVIIIAGDTFIFLGICVNTLLSLVFGSMFR